MLSSPALPAIVHVEIILNTVSVQAMPHCRKSGEQSIGWRSIEQGATRMITAEPKIMLGEGYRFFTTLNRIIWIRLIFFYVCFLLGKVKLFK